MENTWDGVTHDYTRKKHVIYTEVMLPPNAPQEYADRSLLWNSVEWNETKENAQLARSIELALPAELSHEQNIALVRKLVQELFVDKGMCADVAFHDKGDGNPHAHILLTMRPLTPDGKWGDKSRLLAIMQEYNITDSASCAAAVQLVNTKFYSLRSKRKENQDLSSALGARIDSYERRKKFQKYYRTWENLPKTKQGGFERKYEYELRQYRQTDAALRRCQDDGEKIDCKGWKAALDYLNKERFMLDYQLQEMKEEVRRLEIVKREFIQENKKTKSDRYAQ